MLEEDVDLEVEDIDRLFGVLLSELRQLGLTEARTVVAAAGITGVNAPKQYWYPFISGVEAAFHRLQPSSQLSALRILANRFAKSDRVRNLFAQHGYEHVDGTFVPIALLDQREAHYLPLSSASELAKSMKRLTEGDETGAITKACGAVDTLMQYLYEKHQLGNPGSVGFAARVNTAAKHLSIFDEMKSDLIALGMDGKDADSIVDHTRKATDHAAHMLQSLAEKEPFCFKALPSS